MAQLTQIYVIYISVAFVKGHIFFGNDQFRVRHDVGQIPQMISQLIAQNFGHGYAHGYNPGLYRPGMPVNGNGHLGSSSFDYNRLSSILGGNLFGSPDYTSNEGLFSSGESGEPLQQPNSGEDVSNIQIPQGSSISNGNLDGSSIINDGSIVPNDQSGFNGQDVLGNINVDVPNIEIPQVGGINIGIDKKPVDGNISSDLGSQAEGDEKVESNKPATTIDAAGPIVGQLGQVGLPSSESVNETIGENKNDVGSAVVTSGPEMNNVNVNSSSDSTSNLHVNTLLDKNKQIPKIEVATDSQLEETIKDIFKPNDQSNLNIGTDEPKVSVSGISSQNDSKLEIKIPDASTVKDENLAQNKSLAVENSPTDNTTLAVKEDSSQDSTLKTNQVVPPATDNSDVMISKHKDLKSIVFPDKLNEAKDKIQKEKNVSQLSKLNDVNGFDNGQVLYAVNIGPSIVPSNQGVYVLPTATDNGQPVYVNSPSGTSVQYVPQNPSSTVSNTEPSGSITSTNTNGGSPSGGYTLVNVPTNGNSNSGSATYYSPASSGGPSNGYYQIPSNPTQQAYYTVQLSNGQIGLVPVNSGQYVQSNGQGQVIVLNNGQQYVPAQNTGQILYSNGPQYVQSNGQPVQGNNQYVIASNGQHYIPTSSQPMQDNGQILVSSNGQQYMQPSAQPTQGNGQVMIQGNGQQYVQANVLPTQGSGQVMVQGNGQQYVQSNGQPANGQYIIPSNNGQVSMPWSQGTIQNNGQVYVPLNNQSPQGNIITVPAGSIVTVGGNSNSVPLMVFKDKEESSPKPSSTGDDGQDNKKDKHESSQKSSSSDDDDDGEIYQEKDEVVE